MDNMEWKGDEVTKALGDELNKNLKKAAIYYTAVVKQLISRKQARVRYGTHYKGLEPSLPGEPPKMVSAQLVRSIQWVLDENKHEAKIGSSLKVYPAALEFGSFRMAARPYFAPALKLAEAKLVQILGYVQ